MQKCFLVFSVYILLFGCENAIAQSLTGTTGLLTIPTAGMPEDREIYFGANWFNKKYFTYGQNRYHGLVNYATIGYLPFLEISLRLTRLLDHPEPQAMGDRMVSIRLRPFKENRYIPSVVLGIHDFVRSIPSAKTNRFNALYIVTSKGFQIKPFIGKMEFHIGYGTDWMEADQRQFVGLFGGISLSPRPFINFMLEHDAEKLNCGMRMSMFGHLDFTIAFLNMDTFSGGVSYKFKL